MVEDMHLQNEKKRSFILGAVTGIAVVVILGGVFMLGNQYGGGSPKLAAANNNNQAAVQPTQPTQPTANQPQQPGTDVTKIAPVSSSDHILGDSRAPITMIEYSDFQCPFCGRFYTTIQQIMTNYKGKVRLVYRHFPLSSIHPYAEKAAEASECANDQGKFWQLHDKMFELNIAQNFTLDTVKQGAKDIGLDMTKFTSCLDSGKYASLVAKDYQDGVAGGVNGTPGTFVNGQYMAGALPFEEVKPILDSLLKT